MALTASLGVITRGPLVPLPTPLPLLPARRAPGPRPRTVAHRWTKSNSVRLGFNQNCQSSGHAKASRWDSFHKHLSPAWKKKEGHEACGGGGTEESHLFLAAE